MKRRFKVFTFLYSGMFRHWFFCRLVNLCRYLLLNSGSFYIQSSLICYQFTQVFAKWLSPFKITYYSVLFWPRLNCFETSYCYQIENELILNLCFKKIKNKNRNGNMSQFRFSVIFVFYCGKIRVYEIWKSFCLLHFIRHHSFGKISFSLGQDLLR